MIGSVYPSSMGDIRRIYCGEEQCWPKVIDRRFKRFILMDNKIDKNILLAETHQAGMSFDFGGILKYDGHHQMYLSFTKYQIGTDVYYKVIYKQYSKKDDEYNIIIGSTYEHLREIPQAGGK